MSWQRETAMQTSSCQQQANTEFNHTVHKLGFILLSVIGF